ncbi:MAG: hypothetical protein EXR72_26035 [Myxococcales bacterium]|nr:hypothetical protein [Myxococcales bacterium]
MITPGLESEAALAPLRAWWQGANVPVLILPDGLLPEAATRLRAEIAPRLSRYEVADRGRWWWDRHSAHAELFERLGALGSLLIGSSLRLVAARWLRFGHGDYALLKGDDGRTSEPGVELTVDFSEAATGEADVVYLGAGPGDLWAVPQQPGGIVLCDRQRAPYRYERYLTHRVGEAEVHRLRLTLLSDR